MLPLQNGISSLVMSFKRDENLVDIETDKVVLEVPAMQTEFLKRLLNQKVVCYGE